MLTASLPLFTPHSAVALSPESPEVKQVVTKAVAFLEAHAGGSWLEYPGARALVGMCILKQYQEAGHNHPKVLEAVEAIRTLVQKGAGGDPNHLVYDVGICLIFLLELDPDHYRPEMEGLRNLLIKAQQPNGGFGYPTDNGQTSGDISAVQYGVLGLWACQVAKMSVPIDHWERAANFLLRVQDPSGGYGYKAIDPGHFKKVEQPEARVSLSAAGLGSLCISADSLQLFVPEQVVKPTGPAKLTKVEKTETQPRTKNVNLTQVTEALALGRGYFAKNYTSDYSMKPEQFIHYYMYAMERYKSFQAEIDKKQNDNQWYDDGYAFLAKTQHADGSWHTPVYQVPDTCFAILFLMRSTQKLINIAKTYGGDVAQGGRGLPENANEIVLGEGGVRAKPLKGPLAELMQKLNPDDPQFEDAVSALEQKSLVDEGDLLSEMQKRLRRMAEGKSPEAKAAALRLLGRTRDLDNVPLLIEALKDPDPLVFLAANDALRFLARKFSGAGFYGGADESARKEAIKQWKGWYREIRPDAQFDG